MKKQPIPQPAISDDVLEYFEDTFPDKAPRSGSISLTQVGVLIGQQNVLDKLRLLHTKQNRMDT